MKTGRPWIMSLLLSMYPRRWRDRYGDELAAFVEDSDPGGRLRVRNAMSIAVGAAGERMRSAGLLGEPANRRARFDGAMSLALWGWALFVVAGANVAKLSEHYASSLPSAGRSAPITEFHLLTAFAVLASISVATGAAIVLPACIRYFRNGGVSVSGRRIGLAMASSVTTVAMTLLLSEWAHGLSVAQRNGADSRYSHVFVLWAGLVVLTIASWAAAGVHVMRRIEIRAELQRAEVLLCSAVAVLIVFSTAALVAWWASMAATAPGFFSGFGNRSSNPAVDLKMIASVLLMFVACAMGAASVKLSGPLHRLRVPDSIGGR